MANAGRAQFNGDVGINMNPSGYGKLSVNSTGVILALRASSGAGKLGFYEGGAGRFYLETMNGDDGIKFIDGDGSSVRMNIDGHGVVNHSVASEIMNSGNGETDVGGSYLGANGASFGTNAIFRSPTVQSPSSGASSTQFMSVYSSGHWGEYPVFKMRMYETYFVAGYREYLCRVQGNAAYLVEVEVSDESTNFGNYSPTITMSSAVNTGTSHSGQVIYRRDFTVASGGAYQRTHVVVECMYGGNRYYSSAVSASTVDGYTNGGKYHFKTLTVAEMRGMAYA
jgi:hypothetical protein